jgi:chemotaxis protein MotB
MSLLLKKRKVIEDETELPGEEHSDSNWIVSYADMMTLLAVFFIMMLSFAKLDAEKVEEMKKYAIAYFGGTYKIPYEKVFKRIKEMVKAQGLENQVVLEVDESGVTSTFHGAVFFESGQSELLPAGVEVLTKMASIVQQEAGGFRIVVEGHTDDVPITSTMYPSNWELSGSRAARVIRLFESLGFNKGLLTAIGYSDTRPILPNRDEHGAPIPANQSQNRRVVIKILK